MLKRKLEQHRTVAVGLVVEEHKDCIENKFLAYVLDEYLVRLAKAVIGQLDVALQQIPDVLTNFYVPTNRNEGLKKLEQKAISRSVGLKERNERHKDLIIEKKARLQKTLEWALAARKSSLLKDIRTPAHLPKASLRLTHSPYYGPIYARFVQCQTKLDGLGRVLFLLDTLQQRGNKYAWNIYEIWCVAQIYTLLVTRLGLKPPAGEGSLFERAEVIDTGIDLPKNKPFKLVGKFGEHNVEAELWYEKKYFDERGILTAMPDIIVKMMVDDHAYNFCFDAKYRNYKSMGVVNTGPHQGKRQFEADVYATANEKYKQGFSIERFQVWLYLAH